MTTENKLSEAGQVRRNLLIFAGSMAVGILSTLETKYLFERFIPQEHEGGRADPGPMIKTISGKGGIYGYETFEEQGRGAFGGNMIYLSKDREKTWVYTSVKDMSPDFDGGRPRINIFDATTRESGAVYFMGRVSSFSPADLISGGPITLEEPTYKDHKQGLVRNPSNIFVWMAFGGSTKIRYVADFEGYSPSENHRFFLGIVENYDRSIHSD